MPAGPRPARCAPTLRLRSESCVLTSHARSFDHSIYLLVNNSPVQRCSQAPSTVGGFDFGFSSFQISPLTAEQCSVEESAAALAIADLGQAFFPRASSGVCR